MTYDNYMELYLSSFCTDTFPRAAVDVAISKTKVSLPVAGAARLIGLVPSTG